MVDNNTLNLLLQEEIERAISLGFNLGTIDPIIKIDRSHSHYGCCKHLKNSKYKYGIYITKYFLHAPIEEIRTVIMHEVLHTIIESRGHDSIWKAATKKVRENYNYVAGDYHLCDTPYASNRRNFEHTKIKEKENHEKSKYELKCPKCGHIFYRNRMSKIVKNPGNYWHIECGENYRLIRIK